MQYGLKMAKKLGMPHPTNSKIKPISRGELIAVAKELGVPYGDGILSRKHFLLDILDSTRDELAQYHREIQDAKEPLVKALIETHIDICIKEIKRIKWELHKLSDFTEPNDNFKEKIQYAKGVDIKTLLPDPVRRGRTQCPFHEGGSKGSMSVRDNFAWCFHCGKGWDTIDVIMEQQGCSFREAVEYLGGY